MSSPTAGGAETETSTERFGDKTVLQGSMLLSVAYGVELTLFAMSFSALIQQHRNNRDKKAIFFLIYITILFILGTFIIMGIASTDQNSFIDNRYYPLGPSVYNYAGPWMPMRKLETVASTITELFSDALLVWRFITFYKNCGLPLWAIIFLPCLLYIAVFAMAIAFLVFSLAPSSSVFAATTAKFAISYWSLLIFLNIMFTVAIVLRILVYRYHIVRALGSAHGKQYITIAAMIIESAALFSVSSLLFLVTYIVNNPIQFLFGQLQSQIQIVAPMLIILRVSQGKAWTTDTANTVHFIDSRTLNQSPFVAEIGNTQTSSNGTFSSGARDGVSIKATIPREALGNASYASSENFVKAIA